MALTAERESPSIRRAAAQELNKMWGQSHHIAVQAASSHLLLDQKAQIESELASLRGTETTPDIDVTPVSVVTDPGRQPAPDPRS